MTQCCQLCGGRLKERRYGVPLTPIKARIFDLISKRPGITREELAWAVFDNADLSRRLTIGAHIYQIKDAFLDHPQVELQGASSNGYRLKQIRKDVA